MTNKTGNRFRDRKKKRNSAKEAMMKLQRRQVEGDIPATREDLVKVGLLGLIQVAFIYNSWYMEDGSCILENVS